MVCLDKDANTYYMVYEDGEAVPCPTSADCVGTIAFANEGEAQPVFNNNISCFC